MRCEIKKHYALVRGVSGLENKVSVQKKEQNTRPTLTKSFRSTIGNAKNKCERRDLVSADQMFRRVSIGNYH